MSKDKSTKGQDLALTFTGRRHITENCYEYFFRALQNFSWLPGQYLKYTLEHSDVDRRGTTRKFTIIPSSNNQEIGLAARFYDDGSSFKRTLQALKAGDIVNAKGPAGDFVWSGNQEPAVLVAGGIGIAPYVAMLRDWHSNGAKFSIHLIFANSTTEFLYKTMLDELCVEHPNLTINYIVTSVEGSINANKIMNLASDNGSRGSTVYIAGPKLMSKELKRQFKQRYPSIEVKTDSFNNYDLDA